MAAADIRIDPITNTASVHGDLRGKPLAPATRLLPATRSPCPLCALTELPVDENGYVLENGVLRKVRHQTPRTLTTSNRWNVFADSGRSDLVTLKRHAESFEETTVDETADFFDHLYKSYADHSATFIQTVIFINVGVQSGASQAHLHGQIVSSSAHHTPIIKPELSQHSLTKEHESIKAHSLAILETSSAVLYAPWAPTTSGELRVLADSYEDFITTLHTALRLVTKAIGPVAYNIMPLPGKPHFAQILLRLGPKGVYPWYFGTESVTQRPEELAELFRSFA